jgi:Toprim domain
MIGLDVIDQLTGGRLGTFDLPCPECGPLKRSPINQRRPVLRVYRVEPSFAGYCCARCGEKGAALDRTSKPPDPVKLAQARAAATEHARIQREGRLDQVRWLWSQRKSLAGTIAETYLRAVRGYGGVLPATIAFLPARDDHSPAMIAAFGLTHEVEPGVIAIASSAVTGVHLTRLRPDGLAKADDGQSKKMVGFSAGSPIVLGSTNDLLGLSITEGIEDGLSVSEALGTGVWAAGSASRLPALAANIPSWIECVTIVADDDPDGHRHALELYRRILGRRIAARVILAGDAHRSAA